MSKNEIIGALTVERDKANEARDKAIKERDEAIKERDEAIKERDEAREQVSRIEKRDRLKKELADLDKEITKHAPTKTLGMSFEAPLLHFTYTPTVGGTRI